MRSILARLRHRLKHAVRLQDPADLFTEELATDPDFLALGHDHESARLEDTMRRSIVRIVGDPIRLERVALTRIAEHQFVHGTAIVRRRSEVLVMFVMFFEEDDRGLLVLLDREMHGTFARFSSRLSSAA